MKPLYVACVAAIVLAACDDETAPTAVSEPGDAAVKVGFLVSGDRITYPNGARIAVDEVNERGGVLGRSVELVIQMDLQAAAAAVQAAETMILTDEVVALIGPNRSSHAIEVGAVAQSHGVPMVTTAATNPAVTAAAVLTQREEVYSEGIGEFFIDHFGGLGETIVADESYEGGATDFDAQLTRIAAATPGAMFLPGLPPEVTLLTTQARALPLQDAAGEPTRSFSGRMRGTIRRCWTMKKPPSMAVSSAATFRRTRTSQAHAHSSTCISVCTGRSPPAVMRSATMRSGCSWKPQSERAVSTQTSCARNYWLPKDTPGQPTSPTITNIAIRPRARSL